MARHHGSSSDDRGLSGRLLCAHALLLLCALAGGCEHDSRFELFRVTEISSERLDAGRTFSVAGSGFPVGRDVEVVLEGLLRGPLGERARVHHVLEGRTATPERVDVLVTDADVTRLGGRGTFEGALEVVVPGAALDGQRARVVGTLSGLVLDVVPSERRLRGALGREGLALGPLLGLVVASGGLVADEDAALEAEGDVATDAPPVSAEIDEDVPGVAIERVLPDGAARRLGLHESGLVGGARIVAIDGMRVLGPEELLVAPSARAVVLRILGPSGSETSIRVDVDAALGRRRTTSYRYDQLAAIVLVAAVLFGAWPRGRARSSAWRRSGEPGERPYASIVTGLFAIVVVLSVSALAPPGALSLPVWLGASLFLRAAASLFLQTTASKAEDVSSADAGVRVALRRAWRGAVTRESFVLPASALAVTVAIGVFVTAAGSADAAAVPLLGGPLASAAWMPMSWALVRSGFGPLALLCLLAAAAATTRSLSRPSSRRARVLRGLDDLGLAMVASTFVRVAVADPGSTDVVVRATGLVATALLYAGLVRARVSAASLSAPVRAGLATALSGATAGSAALWLTLSPQPATEQAVAEVVLLAIGLVVVRVASLGVRAEELEGGGEPPGLRRQSATRAINLP